MHKSSSLQSSIENPNTKRSSYVLYPAPMGNGVLAWVGSPGTNMHEMEEASPEREKETRA